ncbi:MAG: dihydrofolate reductase [Pseudomonadales bacterium]|mgnify:FL=1|jgi:dihydrofolate reductase|uniref:dihydrofolate reductase n=1 Tax=unclassified Ketobacter TaxID=2639109 RepID=UPI000C991D0E|nr:MULTISPECIES: dihydrofolate reductase [unclassified Ketobacter]MAQ26147.1 dihydrofolate reductase [Pseudomonadales bacterium]MEC8811584.1 dihydrofolate reductase [Pseudomonadota bacterium]TNC90277.1 MAG: dihydrofolate reductase [Alcanivorax sp.]HAG95417.1 dihydrofolate reductase [Gammaproteobacteria bacterium]MCK5790505.1 dihydrofolate reductase [Ketobacter sp.]|tara:strand:+ start:96 stop:587 length:492 start_codon:yes stop_codon:yes gene_type:complete
MISLIVAKADNGVIGRDNKMPWHIPAELKHFKARTMGKPIIMGRKTFDSLGRVLPGRPHVVISRSALSLPENCYAARSLQEAISTAQTLAEQGEVVVIGGAEIYRQALPLVDRLYLTEVHIEPEGDTWFPELNPGDWQETEREDVPADADSAIAYSIVTYQRN